MTPDDARHGTTRGHAAGCRELCCRRARNDDEARRRKYRDALGITRSTDATGTRRRIQALMALGWPSREIAQRCGWTSGEAVLNLTLRKWVHAKTERTIATVFEDLCMTPGPSSATARRAAGMGWPPPLAWDDIDDPSEIPDTGWRPVQARRSAELLAEWDHLRSFGVSEHHAAQQLGVSVEAVEKALERARGAA